MTHVTETKMQMEIKVSPKLIPSWNLNFEKQPIHSNKCKVKTENFIIPIFYIPVFFLRSAACCNTLTFPFSISVSFLFEDFFKATQERIIINKKYKLIC